MFSTILRFLGALWSWRPSSPFKKSYLNFLTIHCKLPFSRWEKHVVLEYVLMARILVDAYIIGISILGSILIYPKGGMSYIDALFMSASASTQCGLNV